MTCMTFQHYIGYSKHYIHTSIVHRGVRNERQNSRCGEVNWCFTPFFNHVWLYMAVSFHSWRKKLFLGVNQQPSVSN